MFDEVKDQFGADVDESKYRIVNNFCLIRFQGFKYRKYRPASAKIEKFSGEMMLTAVLARKMASDSENLKILILNF